jgi:hypothetical protein
MATSTGASKNWYTELSGIPSYTSARFLSDKGESRTFVLIRSRYLTCVVVRTDSPPGCLVDARPHAQCQPYDEQDVLHPAEQVERHLHPHRIRRAGRVSRGHRHGRFALRQAHRHPARNKPSRQKALRGDMGGRETRSVCRSDQVSRGILHGR